MSRKWSPPSKLFAALAVVFGVAAFMVVRGYEQRVQALAPVVGHPVPVVVADQDLQRGTRLTADMLRVATYPSAFAPPGALNSPSAVAGRTLLTGIAAGEPVTRTRLGPARAGPVASLVPEGMEAFAVVTSLPPGSLAPGDRVDVLATFAGGRPHTETVASAVEVLVLQGGGSGDSSGGVRDFGGSASGQSLMLLVTPSQASELAYARAFANLEVAIDGGD